MPCAIHTMHQANTSGWEKARFPLLPAMLQTVPGGQGRGAQLPALQHLTNAVIPGSRRHELELESPFVQTAHCSLVADQRITTTASLIPKSQQCWA